MSLKLFSLFFQCSFSSLAAFIFSVLLQAKLKSKFKPTPRQKAAMRQHFQQSCDNDVKALAAELDMPEAYLLVGSFVSYFL